MRIKASEQIGKVINGFKVLSYKRADNRSLYYVVCPLCGKKTWMRVDAIPKCKSCGCYNREHNYKKPSDISRMKFGRLTALRPTCKRDNNGSVIWICSCECGGCKEVSAKSLLDGDVHSCGCLGAENSIRNGKLAGQIIKTKYCIKGTNINNLSCKLRIDNKSGIKGVTWDSNRNKWIAQIRFRGKKYYLGRYEDKEDAAKARMEAEEQLFGNFLEWYKENHPRCPTL